MKKIQLPAALLACLLVSTALTVSGQDVNLENSEVITWKDSNGQIRNQIFSNGNTFLITPMGSGQFLHFGDGTSASSDTWFAPSSSQTPPSNVSMIIKSTGKIGIGTNDPDAFLHIVNDSGLKLSNSNKSKNSILTHGVEGLEIHNGNGLFMMGFDNSTQYVGIGTTNPNAKLHIAHDSGLKISNSNETKNSFLTHGTEGLEFHNGNGVYMMGFDNSNGNIAIGTTDFSGNHKLRVEGSIGAREIKVEATGWSDFVFEADYALPTIEEVEQHIKEKGHLPEIPSEAEVTENGINLGEMDAKLLQKIEELTLYMIDLNKQNQAQQAQIDELIQKNLDLLERLEEK